MNEKNKRKNRQGTSNTAVIRNQTLLFLSKQKMGPKPKEFNIKTVWALWSLMFRAPITYSKCSFSIESRIISHNKKDWNEWSLCITWIFMLFAWMHTTINLWGNFPYLYITALILNRYGFEARRMFNITYIFKFKMFQNVRNFCFLTLEISFSFWFYSDFLHLNAWNNKQTLFYCSLYWFTIVYISFLFSKCVLF